MTVDSAPQLRPEGPPRAAAASFAVVCVAPDRWVAATTLGDGMWHPVDGWFDTEAEAAAAAATQLRRILGL